jgi:hypothetical protein
MRRGEGGEVRPARQAESKMECDCDSGGGEAPYRKEGEHSMQLLCHSSARCSWVLKRAFR